MYRHFVTSTPKAVGPEHKIVVDRKPELNSFGSAVLGPIRQFVASQISHNVNSGRR